MKKINFALCVSAALFAPVLVGTSAAQATWTATSSPVQATIAGGPWALGQGGSATTGGAYDGPTPYCIPGNSSGGTELVNSSSTVNTFNPYYFPFVVGSGQSVMGYFDYRPKNINEAVVAATSTNAGQSWTFQQMVEQLTTECPNSDANTANSGGNDDGEGHPSVISYGGATWLYTLNRSTPHADSDGLIVHQLLPGANPLNPLPANSPLMQPPTANVIAGWNFDNLSGTQLTPAPSTGAGSAHSLGMTNGYTYTMSAPNVGSVDGSNVTKTTLSSDPTGEASHNIGPNNNEAWRIVGAATTSEPGNGWNLAAPPCTQGAEFDVNTTGHYYIVFQYDWYTTNQGVRDLQALYTTDGSTWTPVGPIQVSGGGSAFNNQITIDFHALGITGVENNSHFGVRLVSVYDPDYLGTPAYSIPSGGNVCSSTATGTYTAASLAGNNQPVVYNNNSGNWRFDEVNVLGTAAGTNPITSDPIVNTTGLVNPDGFLAVVPNTYPIEVLYISKTLNSDYLPPTSYPLCPASIPSGNFNDDVEVVRIATTTDFINFTDITPFNTPQYSTTSSPNAPIQMVNGLSDPSTTSYSGIRWVSGNGTLIPLNDGNWGLFFGGGNCLDGDSDAFHAVMYAESNGSDLTDWNVINGINNPITSIATVSNVTDPQSGLSVTIPSGTPVVCEVASCTNNTLPWYSGRVYAPNAIVTGTGTVSLVFAGYDAGFQLGGSSRDLSSYRNIGQVDLSERLSSTLTYTGSTVSDFDDATNVSAHLVATGGAAIPISARLLTFVLGAGTGTETCTGTTDASGNASCSMTPNQAAGPYTLTVSFSGDALYLASSASTPFTITREETTTAFTATSSTVIANGHSSTFSATLKEDGVTPIAGRTITITLGTAGSAQTCTGSTDPTGTAACSIPVNQPLGPNTVTASFAGDAFYLQSSISEPVILFAFLQSGSMVIGNLDASLGTSVEFWGAQWANLNSLTGGSAPNSFKGFADTAPQSCGGNWTGDPGNSSGPPSGVPSYLGVIGSSSVAKSGSKISGNVPTIIVVKTNPGYGPDPGLAGTGTVVAVFCH